MAEDVGTVSESLSEDLEVKLPDEVTDEDQTSAEMEDGTREMDLTGIEESLDVEALKAEKPAEDVSLGRSGSGL